MQEACADKSTTQTLLWLQATFSDVVFDGLCTRGCSNNKSFDWTTQIIRFSFSQNTGLWALVIVGIITSSFSDIFAVCQTVTTSLTWSYSSWQFLMVKLVFTHLRWRSDTTTNFPPLFSVGRCLSQCWGDFYDFCRLRFGLLLELALCQKIANSFEVETPCKRKRIVFCCRGPPGFSVIQDGSTIPQSCFWVILAVR